MAGWVVCRIARVGCRCIAAPSLCQIVVVWPLERHCLRPWCSLPGLNTTWSHGQNEFALRSDRGTRRHQKCVSAHPRARNKQETTHDSPFGASGSAYSLRPSLALTSTLHISTMAALAAYVHVILLYCIVLICNVAVSFQSRS